MPRLLTKSLFALLPIQRNTGILQLEQSVCLLKRSCWLSSRAREAWFLRFVSGSWISWCLERREFNGGVSHEAFKYFKPFVDSLLSNKGRIYASTSLSMWALNGVSFLYSDGNIISLKLLSFVEGRALEKATDLWRCSRVQRGRHRQRKVWSPRLCVPRKSGEG